MRKILLPLLILAATNVIAKTSSITLKGYVSSVATAYVPSAVFTSSGKDYNLGNNEQSSSKMSDVLDRAGCSIGMNGNEKADCIIEVQLNQKKDTIIKVISAKKLN